MQLKQHLKENLQPVLLKLQKEERLALLSYAFNRLKKEQKEGKKEILKEGNKDSSNN